MRQSLYQEHRPKTFKDVIEQQQVVKILESAVSKDSPAHAYLFTGSRGIGKTSVARIFAKKIGCKDIDIFEIDAASNTSVENIREITNSIYTQPVESKYKVYILDEIHMLSKSAFNAFLKTLEEPPEHVIFILVTTEVEKVPETIVSRCLSLEFKQPSLKTISSLVTSCAKKEGYEISPQSVALIGMMAEGSFRDSLTLLQKILFVSDKKKISHEEVEEVLGAPTHQLVNEYLLSLLKGDVVSGVNALEKVQKSNSNVFLFSRLCIRKLRAALLLLEGVESASAEYSDEDKKFIKSLSAEKRLGVEILRDLVEASNSVNRSYIKVLPLEYILIEKKNT